MSLLIILFIALGLILGFFTRGEALRKLGRVLLFASLGSIFLSIGKNLFHQLLLEQKLIFGIIFLTGSIFVVLRILLGKDLFNEMMGRFVYNGLKAVLLFPFKIIGKVIRNYK